jgi:hypothetical protein
VINMGLLWFVGHQWPEQSRNAQWFRPPVDVFKYVFQVVVLVPSLLGMIAAAWWVRRRPGLSFCTWQLVNSMVVAAIFFGDIRLRTPYDPYAIVLALEGWVLIMAVIARWRGRQRQPKAPGDAAGADAMLPPA